MKWADKIDMKEAGRASEEAVAIAFSPWTRPNLQLRADRDAMNAVKAAEAREATKAEQQRQTTALGAEAAWQ